jgi:hypothetical protein
VEGEEPLWSEDFGGPREGEGGKRESSPPEHCETETKAEEEEEEESQWRKEREDQGVANANANTRPVPMSRVETDGGAGVSGSGGGGGGPVIAGVVLVGRSGGSAALYRESGGDGGEGRACEVSVEGRCSDAVVITGAVGWGGLGWAGYWRWVCGQCSSPGCLLA